MDNPIAEKSKLFYEDFDEYVKDFPEGESFRNWLTNVSKWDTKGTPKEVVIVKSAGLDNGIPGNYLWARKIVYLKEGGLAVGIHDCDDTCRIKHCKDEQEVAKWMDFLKHMAPFNMYELKEFGFVCD